MAALTPMLPAAGASHLFAAKRGPSQQVLSLDSEWRFAGRLTPAALQPGFNDAALPRITLPHTVTPLSWQAWNPASWQKQWGYRRRLHIPDELRGLRLFLRFERVMAAATLYVNGHSLLQHRGGFLPFEYEITHLVRPGENSLAVAVDAGWLNVPPSGAPSGPRSIDYMLPGGITGSVSLHAVPPVFISDVFARPVRVLEHTRSLELTCTVDGGHNLPCEALLEAQLREGARIVAHTQLRTRITSSGQPIRLSLENLEKATLWDVDHPFLYDLVVTLSTDGLPSHAWTTRIGLREAVFTQEGFFLNGRRLQLFGLNRHELYPYVGFAAPPRLLRKDAEILRNELHCNVVRCSHYPQSEAFLDACDELGLMVWEEIPGWQYLGDESWKSLALRDVEAMVRRDRNHPSVIIWGVRVNESPNDPSLYQRARQIAVSLDGSRPTSGTMTPSSRKHWQEEWHQDVFAFDDYHSEDGSVGIDAPLPGVPYMLAETVGQFDYTSGRNFDQQYRRAGEASLQMRQALLHAMAHDRAARYPRCAGVIAWCAFDYASLMNAHDGVKCPGIADVFRIPKLGASFYRAQVSPEIQPVIEPSFYWDCGSSISFGPGEKAVIFSNCEQLSLFLDGTPYATLTPDRTAFPHLRFPPFLSDLPLHASANAILRMDGYVGGKLVLSRSMSADRTQDQFRATADHLVLDADGADATRLVFEVTDVFGNPRFHAAGEVAMRLSGPGVLVGDNPFLLQASGGVGAVWIKTIEARAGLIQVHAEHSRLGARTVEIRSRQATRNR